MSAPVTSSSALQDVAQAAKWLTDLVERQCDTGLIEWSRLAIATAAVRDAVAKAEGR